MNYRSSSLSALLAFTLSVQPAFAGSLKFSAEAPKPPTELL